MRGRLIFPLLAEVYRVDRAGMLADPDGPGPLGSGIDPDFHEPVVWDVELDRGRRERAPVRLPCQVEPAENERLTMTAAGNAPRSRLALLFHARDLAALGLLDTGTGELDLGVGDRLAALVDHDGRPAQVFAPGLFVVEVRPLGFGLGRRPTRNLFLVTFEDRPQAARRLA